MFAVNCAFAQTWTQTLPPQTLTTKPVTFGGFPVWKGVQHIRFMTKRRSAFFAAWLLFIGSIDDLAHGAPSDQSYGANPGNLIFARGLYVSIGPCSHVRTSVDGKVWTERSSGTPSSLHAITYGTGLFVAVGNEGAVVSSPDGVSWTVADSCTDERLRAIAFGAGIFVAE